MDRTKTTHAFKDDTLADHDACDLAELINSGEISIQEVIIDSVKRAKEVEPDLNAIVTEDFEAAIKQSTGEKGKGFFSGVPLFFKDLTAVKGLPNLFGSEAFRNAKPAKKNDPIAEQILAQGFINLGMSTLPEFGMTCSTDFPNKLSTANPWNLDYGVGGSSGGAAALVAAGVVPIAHGADGGGSIRIPAACCGLVGLKPTRGRLLASGAFEKQLVEISTDGIVSRSVRDTAKFYMEAEKYYLNKKLKPIGESITPLDKSLRIGYSAVPPNGTLIDSHTDKTLEDTKKLLSDLGHTLVPVEFPLSQRDIDDFRGLWAINGYFLYRWGKQLFGSHYEPERMTKFMKGLSKTYNQYILKTPFFIHRLKKSYIGYQEFLKTKEIDVWLTPTLSHITPKHGYLGMNLEFEQIFDRMGKWASFTPYSNANGCPSISLPLGHVEEENLPIGMMLWADLGEDRLLLELASQIEEERPWRKINAI